MGKSAFAKHMALAHGAFTSGNGKTADIAYLWQKEKILLFDFTRSSAERVNYGALEELKNGHMVSMKYQCTVKIGVVPHVCCFSNQLPNWTAFSEDRYDVRVLAGGELVAFPRPGEPIM